MVLGGGLSGVAAAYALARGGYKLVTVLESGATIGGLAKWADELLGTVTFGP